jgi:hypothetical protein
MAQKWGKSQADFCHAPTTNLTQHNPLGPDDHPKTIDYHHLDMARDDGMDEHETCAFAPFFVPAP